VRATLAQFDDFAPDAQAVREHNGARAAGMTVTIEQEPFDMRLFEQILPLGQKCWEESTILKDKTCAYYGERDFQIVPDVEQYQRFADSGALLIVTVRDSARMVGYLAGFTYRSLHHKRILGAICDSIYIEPDYRSYAVVAIEKFETQMASRGATILGWPTTPNGPIHRILEARGFVGDDIVMEKRLCV
jgi:hypothetical protein